MNDRTVGYAATDRHGQAVLLIVFICLLGGRFTLDRVSPGLPALDLRVAGLAVALSMFGLWVAAARDRMAGPVRVGAGLYWFLAWCGYMALSSLWATDGARISTYLPDLGLLAAFILLGIAVLGRLSRQATTVVWRWLYGLGFIYFAGALAAGPDAQGRYAAFGGGPNVFVRVMVLATIAALFLAARSGRLRALLVGVPIFLVGAVLSGSRGGLLAFAVVLLVGLAPLLRRLPRGSALLAVAGAGAMVATAPVVLGASIQQTLAERFIQQTLEQHYSSGRTEIIASSWGLFEQHPFIGVGLDGFYAEVGRSLGFEYPHNLVVAAAVEGGLLGLLLVSAALLAFGWSTLQHRPLCRESLFALLAGLYLLGASMFSGDYYDSRFVWFFLGWAAIEARRHVPAPAAAEDQFSPPVAHESARSDRRSAAAATGR